MGESAKKIAVRFAVLEGVYWSIMASYAAYVASFGLSRGYAQGLVSVMIAVYMLCALAGQFFWGSMCDKLRTNKKIFILGVMLAGLAQLGMYFAEQPLLFGILYGLFGFLLGPMGSILDTWMLKSLHNDMKLYGISRGTGSGCYAVVILIMGNLIQRFGYFMMPLCSSVVLLVTVAVALATKDAEITGDKHASIAFKDIMSIMKIPSYVLILVIMFFIGMANSPISNLKIMVLQSVGGDVSTQGLDSFCGCVVQFLVFIFAGAFTRIPAKTRLYGSAFLVVAALLVDYTATAPWMIVIGTVLLFGTYSILIPASREIVMRSVKYEYQTTANGLVDAVYSSLAGTVSLLYAGALAQRAGVKSMILVSLLFAIVPVILLIVQAVKKGMRQRKLWGRRPRRRRRRGRR